MQNKLTLVFVYNADSGFFNLLTDAAHKMLSPATYDCNLCALTHGHLGPKKQWREFLKTLDRPLEFLHADELKNKYGITGQKLPAIFTLTDGDKLAPLIDDESINRCESLEQLKKLIEESLR